MKNKQEQILSSFTDSILQNKLITQSKLSKYSHIIYFTVEHRQVGLTQSVLVAMLDMVCNNPDINILYIGNDYENCIDRISDILKEKDTDLIITKTKSKKLEFSNGSRIKFESGLLLHSLVGIKPDFIACDDMHCLSKVDRDMLFQLSHLTSIALFLNLSAGIVE